MEAVQLRARLSAKWSHGNATDNQDVFMKQWPGDPRTTSGSGRSLVARCFLLTFARFLTGQLERLNDQLLGLFRPTLLKQRAGLLHQLLDGPRVLAASLHLLGSLLNSLKVFDELRRRAACPAEWHALRHCEVRGVSHQLLRPSKTLAVLQVCGAQPGRHRPPPTREHRPQHQQRQPPTRLPVQRRRETLHTLCPFVRRAIDCHPGLSIGLGSGCQITPALSPESHILEQTNSQSITPPVAGNCR